MCSFDLMLCFYSPKLVRVKMPCWILKMKSLCKPALRLSQSESVKSVLYMFMS